MITCGKNTAFPQASGTIMHTMWKRWKTHYLIHRVFHNIINCNTINYIVFPHLRSPYYYYYILLNKANNRVLHGKMRDEE